MPSHRRAGRASALGLLCALLVEVATGGCTSRVRLGTFPDTAALETTLRRGVSTRADVERVLGKPGGVGAALLPTQAGVCDVWVYQDIEVGRVTWEAWGTRRMQVRQQVLLVFFKADVVDGFMWYSNAGAVTGVSYW